MLHGYMIAWFACNTRWLLLANHVAMQPCSIFRFLYAEEFFRGSLILFRFDSDSANTSFYHS